MQKINDKFVWSNDNINFIKCSACKQCWIKSRKNVYQSHNKCADESNALLVGKLYTQNLITFLADVVEKICARGKRRRKRCTGTEHTG